jgi:hypothetical protein
VRSDASRKERIAPREIGRAGRPPARHKQNPDALRDILENDGEMDRALRGTPFERYLEA